MEKCLRVNLINRHKDVGRLSSWDLKHLCPECNGPALKESHTYHAAYGNQFMCAMAHQWPCDCNPMPLYNWIGTFFPNKKRVTMMCDKCLIAIYDLDFKESDAQYIRDFNRLFSVDFICFHCGKIWWRI
jgi:uncharacterized protein with PIN domain